MIIASDIDRTLLYSERSLMEFGRPQDAKLIPVEYKNGRSVGYMTEKASLALRELCGHCLFVPVTTRTTEQYKRFTVFQGDVVPLYAITANGAVILYKGEPIREWSEEISKQIRSASAAKTDLLLEIEREGIRFNGKLKQADDIFLYYILEEHPSASELEALDILAMKNGWRLLMQGRKLYLIPLSINKGDALKFVSCQTNQELLAGAGDSIFDWDFLQYCSHRFVPKHGILASVSISSGLKITKHEGVLAGEEILDGFLALTRLKI